MGTISRGIRSTSFPARLPVGKPHFGLSKNGAFAAESPCDSTISENPNQLNNGWGEAHFASPSHWPAQQSEADVTAM